MNRLANEPVSKVTIVSTLPFVLTERKPGQIPGYYEIKQAPTKDTVGITHITDAWFPELVPYADERTPARRTHIPAENVARGIVEDYIGASLAAQFDPLDNGSYRLPGIFWVNGVLGGKEVLDKESFKVNQARGNTLAWFEALVKLADDTWEKLHQHVAITDLQRRACTYLGFKDREWNVNVIEQLASVSVCPACRSQVNKEAILCFNCKYVLDPAGYAKNKDRFAGV